MLSNAYIKLIIILIMLSNAYYAQYAYYKAYDDAQYYAYYDAYCYASYNETKNVLIMRLRIYKAYGRRKIKSK